MRTAPASDLTFSQMAPPRADRTFFFPRACETTLAAIERRGEEEVMVENLPTAPTRARVPSSRNGRGGVPMIGTPPRSGHEKRCCYFRCLFTSFVISNIETWLLPPKMGLRFSSALML